MDQDANEPQPREGMDIPFGPPPEEDLYRCAVCGEEMLVNEAIMDVAIGAATFRGEYRGACRRLGARDATARPWHMSITRPSPPAGR